MHIRALCLSTVVLFPACSDEPTAPPARPPHIFLVTIDTLRWDYLGPYGYKDRHISPAVDRLARNGTVFEQVVSSAGTTVPSHGTMFTGLYPRQHGARSNLTGLYPEARTIAQALQDAGYNTAAMISFQGMINRGDLGRGFQKRNAPFNRDDHKLIQPGQVTLREANEWL